MFTYFFGGLGAGNTILISSNTDDYNLYTALGSPSHPINATVIIETGVVVGSTSTSNAAFSFGSLHSNSKVKLINNGSIIGAGGVGGDSANNNGQTACPTGSTDGLPGGDSMDITVDVTLDNTNGNIFGGGGGGGAGAPGAVADPTYRCCGGGGGGGGAGNDGGIGGLKSGVTNDGPPDCQVLYDGVDGSPGTSAAGAGGSGGVYDGNTYGGAGGTGGEYGAAGAVGNAGHSGAIFTCSDVGAGGAAGKAVELNGNAITWLGGNNGTQVKGAVS